MSESRSARKVLDARLHDPVGPRWTRFVLPALALVCGLLDYAWAALDDASPGPAFYFAAIIFMWSGALLGRHRSRACKVALQPGHVSITGAGILDQAIHTDDIAGASTSISPDSGTSVALARKDRKHRAMHLEVESPAQANEIRAALGIGFGGYGTLRWKLRPTRAEILTAVIRFAGSIAALRMAYTALHEDPQSVLVTIVFATALLWSVITSLMRAVGASTQGLLWFNDFGIFYGKSDTTEHVAYADIEDAHATNRAIVLKLKSGASHKIPIRRVQHALNGVSKFEVEHIVAQIQDAARRARGEVQTDGREEAFGIEMLARSSADTARAWLDRLDQTAATIGGGYRSVNLTQDALIATLADPDAAPDLRIGAARVLHRLDPNNAKVRVAEIAETVREESLRKRMRVVLEDDSEEAAAELVRIADDEERRMFQR